MPGPAAPVAAARTAVRRSLEGIDRVGAPEHQRAEDGGPVLVLVACSGGADSLALAAATAFVAPRLGLRAGAVVVDHALQEESGATAQEAARTCRELGLSPVEVVRVDVARTGEGPEADARTARYAALTAASGRAGAVALLLGHTADDQAEQVLLGLLRGSGARSLSAMSPSRELAGVRLLRPFLGLDRAQTTAVCADLGLEPWSDPHNEDPTFARVRARSWLSTLEEELGSGVRVGLVRSADLLRDDADALDAVSDAAYRDLGDPPWRVEQVLALPRAVRTRLWRRAALSAGSPGTDLSARHLLLVDSLLTDWRGQGPLHLPGGVRARRDREGLWIGPQGGATMSEGTMAHEPGSP